MDIDVKVVGKKCPKCGRTVSCRQWSYGTGMCRLCDGRTRAKKIK